MKDRKKRDMKSQLLTKGARGAALTLLAAVAAAMASCIKDNAQDVRKTLPDLPEDKVRIGLYTSAGDYQTPTTRATANEGLAPDDKPWVFVFAGNDGTATFAEVKRAEPGATGEPPTVALTQRGSPVRVLIVANAPAKFYNGAAEADFNELNLTTALANKNFADAVNGILNTVRLTTSPTTSTIPYVTPKTYLPMTGIVELAGITAGTSIGGPDNKVELTRIVAKVTVENQAEDFELLSASVVGAKKFGRLFKGAPIAGIETIDFAESIVTATGTAGAENTTDSPLYIYESEAGVTSVIVKGKYVGTEGYYRLAFKSRADGTVLPVERNKHYKFEILSVTGHGYASVDEAIDEPAATVSNPVIFGVVEVSDLSSHDIIDNGGYYLGVSNSEFIVFSDDDVQNGFFSVTVATDAVENEIALNSVTATEGLTISPTTLNLSTDGTTAGVTELKLNNFTANVTSGTITIKLGNLQKKINVTRRAPLASAASVTVFADVYAAGKIEQGSGENYWLSLSLDGVTSEGSEAIGTGAGSIYLMAKENLMTDRSAVLYLYRHNSGGRVKLYIKQKGS